MKPADFYEEDEPLNEVEHAFDHGDWVTVNPCGWYCPHISITTSMIMARPSVGCGCQMQPLISVGGSDSGN